MPPQGGRKHPHQEFLTIDTTNILFICGGAFADLDKVIERRIGNKGVGFGAAIVVQASSATPASCSSRCLPEDLVHYGLIPEFIGRLPVISARAPAARARTSSRSSTEPRNALVKQFQRFFSFDDIELVFSDDALSSVAEKALERETGARGLRSIIEEVLLEVQFELPSRRDVKKCVVTRETVEKGLHADARHRGRRGRADRRPRRSKRPAERSREVGACADSRDRRMHGRIRPGACDTGRCTSVSDSLADVSHRTCSRSTRFEPAEVEPR